jgi:DNA uptake protein ComE-like DNA-binding protein
MILGLLALFAAAASPGLAQVGGAPTGKGLMDPNTASASDLQTLPAVTPAIAKAVIVHRPYKSPVDLNKVLLDQKLTQPQATEVYKKAFVKINLDTGTKEEFMLIPGVGARMSAEFAEYRPWKSWAQFDKEIGKYVGQTETDRFKQFMIMPSK